MRRKILALVLAALLAFAMAACASAPEETVPTTAAPETTVPVTTEAATEPTVEETTEPTEPPLVLHSGLREDGSFDEGTLFIGDSMTCILVENYLKPNGLLGDANYTGKYGAHITAFFDDTVMSYTSYNHCAFRPEHEGMGYDEVAAQLGEDATAIYMMWGTNFTWNAYADAYIEVTDYLLEVCPNATVHLQLIPYGAPDLIFCDTVNGWIREAYAHYQQIGQERVMLIDTYTAIGKNTDEGHIHLSAQGNENWYNAIVDHAKENNLSIPASAAEPVPEETKEPEETTPRDPAVLHSGLKEDGTFDEGTLFMGDSLTYMLMENYLKYYDLIGEANYAAMCGTKSTAFFDDTIQMGSHYLFASTYSPQFAGMPYYKVAAEMGADATAIYFMWGTNYEPNATVQTYIDIVDYLLETCPNATIHMQLIPFGEVDFVTVNEKINAAYDHFQDAGEERVFLIDTFTAIGRNAIDGVHQGEVGNRRWYEAIVAHAEANGLVQ